MRADRRFTIELDHRQPHRRELDRINNLIAASTGTWKLTERVKRISLPLYQYREIDLEYMQFVIARTGKLAEIVGLAVVEEADVTECLEHRAMLLHGIYVDPRHHRRGVGSSLLETAESISVANHASGLLVKAQPDALHFFAARGYQRLAVADRSRDYAYRFWKSI
jgi:GNAT superfamily N-acetyltransferase